MKCPLIRTLNTSESGLTMLVPGECLRDECAWYSRNMVSCVVFVIYEELRCIGNSLTAIAHDLGSR